MLSLETNAVDKKKKGIRLGGGQNTLVLVLGGLLVVALGALGYLYYHFTHNQTQDVKTEEELLRDTVGSKVLLPEEAPQIATVTDKTKLADQPFFKKAENGDKILIFTNSGKAVLYRPRIKKVIDITTISLTPEAGQPAGAGTTPETMTDGANTTLEDASASVEPTERLNVAIYNGSQKIGITNTFDDELKGMYKNIDVVLKETAVKSDYAKSIVVDLTGTNAPFAKDVAKKINGDVGNLPDGEKKPENTDILIILGNNDYKAVP